MIHTHTSFGKLKEVIVGRELGIKKREADFSFKYFFKDNLSVSSFSDKSDYIIDHKILKERKNDLDSLASILQDLGIKVHRPSKVNSINPIQTPSFKSVSSSAANVRDILFAYGNTIIETPVLIRNRLFETHYLKNILHNYMCDGSNWIKCPEPELIESRHDLMPWEMERNFKTFDMTLWDMGLDGAQCLRVGKDVICNVSTYNHYLGYLWMKKQFPGSNFHRIKVTDNHIDGIMAVLRPGVLLINSTVNFNVPEIFNKWEIIYSEHSPRKGLGNISLASNEGMDVNVLSINEDTVLVNENANDIIKILESKSFNVIPIQFRHSEIFAGGIHCSTLDTIREDDMISYL